MTLDNLPETHPNVVVDLATAREFMTMAAEVRAVAEYVEGHPAAQRLWLVADRLEDRAKQGGMP